jgi:hypothetical protein
MNGQKNIDFLRIDEVSIRENFKNQPGLNDVVHKVCLLRSIRNALKTSEIQRRRINFFDDYCYLMFLKINNV